MVSAINIAVQFGGRYLFRDVSFRIGPHDRIGLVGSNGAGKTTLLRLLMGEGSQEAGEIAKAKFVNVGYLPQEGVQVSGRTLYEEAETVFSDIREIESRLADIHRRMGEVRQEMEEFHELLELSGDLQHKLENMEAFRIRSDIEKVLAGLGFAKEDLDRPTDAFSGGWQMRIALAKLLLLQPSLLLLDEPTNHLDLDSLQWLEEYLRSYEGAVMIVSHDRRFLDNMTRKTYELSMGKFVEYPGNYTYYLQAKEERKEQQQATYRNQQAQIKHTERFIERFRYKATKARQVQSRIKALEKMDPVELEEEEGGIRFHFPPAPRSGRVVMQLQGIHKSYGMNRVFGGVDFDIERGEKIAFVGVNGAGKSTLARILAGEEPFDAGTRAPGHNVAITYFAQHQAEELDPDKEVLQTLEESAAGETRARLRTLLGSFLFRGDDVFKKVVVLSGGEKSRLALARMLLQPSNLIVLDEPTNHLDMRSKTIVQDALAHFDGSCVIVSHDRDFLDPLVHKVVEFRRGGIRAYLGNVSDYLLAKQEEARQLGEIGGIPEKQQRVSERERRHLEAEQRQRRYERTKPLKEQIDRLESGIAEKERRKTEIEQRLAEPDLYKHGEEARDRAAEYQLLGTQLSDDYFRWGELTKELERIIAEENSETRR
jgi:ATP-binding cassette subfamily F protein 3